jgi:hypothetical protein
MKEKLTKEVIITMENYYRIVSRSIEQAWKYCNSTLDIRLRSEFAAQEDTYSFDELS